MRAATIHDVQKLDYAGAESMNTICTNLLFSGRDLRKIVITSSGQSEGKSWMSMHLATNLAQRGRTVVLVDADLRRSFLVKRYKMETEGELVGLAHFLSGQREVDDVVYQTDLPGVYILPAGCDVTNPISLIDTPYFVDLLNDLAAHFDFVLVDAPPIGMVVDAADIASSCDGSVLVLEYNKTRLREVAECKRQMEQSGTPVLGCIINKVDFDTISAKKYYNKSYYSHYVSGYYRKKQNE